MAAAVADFRPKAIAGEKLKKRDGLPEIVLEPTPDILGALGASQGAARCSWASRPRPSGCAEHAAEKLAAKRVDLMVANDVSAPDAGFEVDTNRAILLDSSGRDRGDAAAEQGRAGGRHPRSGRQARARGRGSLDAELRTEHTTREST